MVMVDGTTGVADADVVIDGIVHQAAAGAHRLDADA